MQEQSVSEEHTYSGRFLSIQQALSRQALILLQGDKAFYYAEILSLLKAHPAGLTQKEIALKLGQNKTSVSRLVADLEAEGLAERKKVFGDRRFRVVSISPLGLAKIGKVEKALEQSNELILGALSLPEQMVLNQVLEKLERHISNLKQ